jgi:hypothetical protein
MVNIKRLFDCNATRLDIPNHFGLWVSSSQTTVLTCDLSQSSRLPRLHDHVRNIKPTITKPVDINDSTSSQIWQDIGDTVGSCLSPSGNRRAILREVKSQSSPKRYTEIWRDNQIEASTDVTETHGGFYVDGKLASTNCPVCADNLLQNTYHLWLSHPRRHHCRILPRRMSPRIRGILIIDFDSPLSLVRESQESNTRPLYLFHWNHVG